MKRAGDAQEDEKGDVVGSGENRQANMTTLRCAAAAAALFLLVTHSFVFYAHPKSRTSLLFNVSYLHDIK